MMIISYGRMSVSATAARGFMMYENYYKETPQERKTRRHEEDKIRNPDRHNINKDRYTHEELFELCFECLYDARFKYEYFAPYDAYVKK